MFQKNKKERLRLWSLGRRKNSDCWLPSHPSGLEVRIFQKRGLHWLQMRPWTRSLHWHSSPLGTDPHPAKASTTPAGSQLQSEMRRFQSTNAPKCNNEDVLQYTFTSWIIVESIAAAIAVLAVEIVAALAASFVVTRNAQRSWRIAVAIWFAMNNRTFG